MEQDAGLHRAIHTMPSVQVLRRAFWQTQIHFSGGNGRQYRHADSFAPADSALLSFYLRRAACGRHVRIGVYRAL